MSAREAMNRDVNTFYRRWAAHELTLGKEASPVLDFDYAPVEDSDVSAPFVSRLAALEAVETLITRLTALPENDFSNHEFLRLKLNGSAVYLRTLLGERVSFHRCIESALGITPLPVPPHRLEQLGEAAKAQVATAGFRWASADLQRFQAAMAFGDLAGFGDSLREAARNWVDRVQRTLGIELEPRYRIETVAVDEYWHNWIEGVLGQDILLRINTHPRSKFYKGDEVRLAAHEIAGHAMQMSALSEERQRGRLESCLLNTAVHTLEMFQFEGLAQSVLHLFATDDELPPEVLLSEALHRFHLAVINNAQCAIEAGEPIDRILRDVQAAAPLLDPLSFSSDLRDRSKNPFFRAYVFVYAPSLETFLHARELPHAEKLRFLREMYTGFWTPTQITAKLPDGR